MSTVAAKQGSKSTDPQYSPLFWAFVFALPPFFFSLSWGLYEIVISHAHYGLGALLTLFFGVIAGGMTSGKLQFEPHWKKLLKDQEDERVRRHLAVVHASMNVSAGLACILLLVTMCAWISYYFRTLGAFTTEGTDATYADFVSLYSWHLVDLVPGLNVEKTLGLKEPPLELKGWIAGAPVIAFRLLVAAVGFAWIKKAWADIFTPSQS